jgi:hypothetical protein
MYRQIEELRERKGEKMVAFLTMENTMGAGAGGITLFILGAAFDDLIKWLLTGSGLLIGLILTLDWGGVALYQRLLWIGRGLLRQWLHGGSISPDTLAGTTVVTHREPALRVGGPIEIVTRDARSRFRARQ